MFPIITTSGPISTSQCTALFNNVPVGFPTSGPVADALKSIQSSYGTMANIGAEAGMSPGILGAYNANLFNSYLAAVNAIVVGWGTKSVGTY